jgi:HlyD family secretion protein
VPFAVTKVLGKKGSWVAAAALVLLAAGGISAIFVRRTASANEYFTETISRGPIRNVVNATGTLQAVLTVQVGAQVSGQIQTLYADFNSVVKHGQLLAKIDPRNYEAQVAQAKANLAAAEANVSTAEANMNNQIASLESTKANMEAAKVARDNAQVIFQRYAELLKSGVVSQNDYDNAKATADGNAAKYEQAVAQVKQGEAQINSSKAQVAQAKAQVEQSKAALNQAQVNLDYTTIYSPVDGVVVSRSVDVGQSVAASLQTPLLFTIAYDLSRMQVNASVDEADIGNVSNTVDVQFTVDAYRNDIFKGKITEIRLNPQTVQNVVTYSVIINVDNEQLKLKPGMTANIVMTIARRTGVLKLPNASLRYLPPGVTRDQVAEMIKSSPVQPAAASNQPPDGAEPNAPAPETAPGAGDGKPSPGGEQRGNRQNFGRSNAGQAGRPGAVGGRPAENGDGGFQTPMAPGQLWNPAEKIQFPQINRRGARPAVVWVLGPDKKPEPKQVVLGITDGSSTEVVSGDLKEGDKIIVADTSQAATAQGAAGPRPPTGPMPFGLGRR